VPVVLTPLPELGAAGRPKLLKMDDDHVCLLRVYEGAYPQTWAHVMVWRISTGEVTVSHQAQISTKSLLGSDPNASLFGGRLVFALTAGDFATASAEVFLFTVTTTAVAYVRSVSIPMYHVLSVACCVQGDTAVVAVNQVQAASTLSAHGVHRIRMYLVSLPAMTLTAAAHAVEIPDPTWFVHSGNPTWWYRLTLGRRGGLIPTPSGDIALHYSDLTERGNESKGWHVIQRYRLVSGALVKSYETSAPLTVHPHTMGFLLTTSDDTVWAVEDTALLHERDGNAVWTPLTGLGTSTRPGTGNDVMVTAADGTDNIAIICRSESVNQVDLRSGRALKQGVTEPFVYVPQVSVSPKTVQAVLALTDDEGLLNAFMLNYCRYRMTSSMEIGNARLTARRQRFRPR
jgi:hypothetical protein